MALPPELFCPSTSHTSPTDHSDLPPPPPLVHKHTIESDFTPLQPTYSKLCFCKNNKRMIIITNCSITYPNTHLSMHSRYYVSECNVTSIFPTHAPSYEETSRDSYHERLCNYCDQQTLGNEVHILLPNTKRPQRRHTKNTYQKPSTYSVNHP
jgi:hypothetical protein